MKPAAGQLHSLLAWDFFDARRTQTRHKIVSVEDAYHGNSIAPRPRRRD